MQRRGTSEAGEAAYERVNEIISTGASKAEARCAGEVPRIDPSIEFKPFAEDQGSSDSGKCPQRKDYPPEEARFAKLIEKPILSKEIIDIGRL